MLGKMFQIAYSQSEYIITIHFLKENKKSSTLKTGLRSRVMILPTPTPQKKFSRLRLPTPQKNFSRLRLPTPQKIFSRLPTPQKNFSRLRLLKKNFPDSDSSKNFFPTPDSSSFFLPTPTPQNMPGLPTPKTCLSYNKIIVIFKGSESAVSFKEALVFFFQIF